MLSKKEKKNPLVWLRIHSFCTTEFFFFDTLEPSNHGEINRFFKTKKKQCGDFYFRAE